MIINSIVGSGSTGGRPCVIAVHEGGVEYGGTFVVNDVPFEVVGVLLFSAASASTHGMYQNKETGDEATYYGNGKTSESYVDFSQSGAEVTIQYPSSFTSAPSMKVYLCLFGKGGTT